MAESVDSVVLQLEARLGDYNAQVAGAANNTERSLGRVQQSATRTEKVMGQAFSNTRISQQILQHVARSTADSFAAGTPPLMIFTSHIGQLAEAGVYAGGSLGKVGEFLAGPWGIAATLAATALLPLVVNLFKAHDAAELAKTGANGLATAESALGEVFDTVSGKLKTQNELLILNARLTAINLRAAATQKRAAAHDTFVAAQQTSLGDRFFGGGVSDTAAARAGVLPTSSRGQGNADALQQLLVDVGSGKLSRDQALQKTSKLNFSGVNTTREKFEQAIVDSATANINDRAADLIDKSLNDRSLAPQLRQPGSGGRSGGGGGAGRGGGRTGAANAAQSRIDDQITQFAQRALTAREQMARSADEAAEYELRSTELARIRTMAEIDANDSYTAAEKDRLKAEAEEAVEQQRQLIEFRKRARLEQEAQQLADTLYQTQNDVLHQQYELADTEKQRKAIALQILDADDAYLKSKLEAVIASQTATDAEKKNAQVAIDALNATAGLRRQGVSRANETSAERYLRELHRTPEQIGEDFDKIKMAGLDRLNDGIVDAIAGAKSLGAAFHDVANQIISDLLRIAIRRAIIEPLANVLFPHGGGTSDTGGSVSSIGGILGSLGGIFGGHRAMGGPVAAGVPYMVGERGQELFVPSMSGMIVPNQRLGPMGQSGGVSVVRLELSGDIDARIQRVSGPVAVQVVRASAPSLIDASASETIRRAGRPKL